MNRFSIFVSFMLATSFASSNASAQNVKPGLWEASSKMSGASGAQMDAAQKQMQEAMAKMPPEQRKQMEAMMSKQGVQLGGGGAGQGMTAKFCMSKEMAEGKPVPPQPGCTHNLSARTGNTQKFSFNCTQPPSSGTGTVTFQGDSAYDMQMQIKNTGPDGKPRETTISSQAKFVASDCGNLKPIGSK